MRLTIIVAFGALLRIVRFAVTKWDRALMLNDSLYYSLQAHQLAHGVWFRELFTDQPGAEHGPLTSTLMARRQLGERPRQPAADDHASRAEPRRWRSSD